MSKIMKQFRKKVVPFVITIPMVTGILPANTLYADEIKDSIISTYESFNTIGKITNISVDGNKVNMTLSTNEKIRVTFLTPTIFRLNLEPTGNFVDEPEIFPKPPSNQKYEGKMLEQPLSEWDKTAPTPTQTLNGDYYEISTNDVTLKIHKDTSLMSLVNKKTDEIVWSETEPLKYDNSQTIQTLATDPSEYFYGGGQQNGFFSHKGRKINIVNENSWSSGAVSSPNPFYVSTDGYGVMRYTWKKGYYDFGAKGVTDKITTTHEEKRFDAFYFVGETVPEIINEYTKITGKVALLPEYGFYLGHANAYNRDWWDPITGKEYQPSQLEGLSQQIKDRLIQETLLEKEAMPKSLLATGVDVAKGYVNNDMPFGWFLPNDGYGAGYGQTDSLQGDLENLKAFTDEINKLGFETGLWTQSNIWPVDPNNPVKGDRDIEKEVGYAGVRGLKTDVAWVSQGYAMALNSVKIAANAITTYGKYRPFIISLDGWAGTQRYASLWSGDQTGGNWEYIRFHIPTYIGSGLSGNPNVGSDMDGIWGGSNTISTRDYQWKAFTPIMIDMDGWGSNRKFPFVFKEPYTSINRMYLKLKSEMLPYTYSIAAEANQTSKPMIRAMFLEFPEDSYTYGTQTQYQYMYGPNLLVAPVYNGDDNDAEQRNGIYLPDSNQIWIDYFTGIQYQGGGEINEFSAPLWKLPLFIKNGAIIPMTVENNSPKRDEKVTDPEAKNLDGTEPRIFDVYPAGNTEFELYEDDGVTEKYKENVYATTKITSTAPVTGTGTAVITVAPAVMKDSSKDYTAINKVKSRETEFIVNVQQEPTNVIATIGSTPVTLTKVTTQKDFDDAIGNVYFYNEEPNLNKYATKDSDFANVEILTTPKLYVKVEATDITLNAVTLTVEGFNNTYIVEDDGATVAPSVPKNLRADIITPTSINLVWDGEKEVPAKYELKVVGNGVEYSIKDIKSTKYIHKDLPNDMEYTYKIRAINSKGRSDWSDVFTIKTDLDPYRNVPPNLGIKIIDAKGINYYGQGSGGAIERAVDGRDDTEFHTEWNASVNFPADVIIDMKLAYRLDKFEYLPRADSGNGTVTKVDLSASLDGKHWNTFAKDVDWPRNGLLNTYDIPDEQVVVGRYIKMTAKTSTGAFISGREIRPYKIDGTNGLPVGDTLASIGVIDIDDLDEFRKLYAGARKGDSLWNQVPLSDINFNDIIDAYDLAFIASQLDGGVKGNNSYVDGTLKLIPSKTDLSVGDEIEINVVGNNLNDIYAFNLDMPFDYSKYEILNLPVATQLTSGMENLSKINPNKTITDQQYADRFYIAFTNTGNKATITNKTEEDVVLATFKIRAKQNITFDMIPNQGILVNSDLKSKDALTDDDDNPETLDPYRNVPKDMTISAVDGNGATVQDQQGSEVTKAVDNDNNTFWHSKWYQDVKLPVVVKIDMGKYYNLEKLEYLPIPNTNNSSRNGTITKFDFAYQTYDGDWITTNTNIIWDKNDNLKTLVLPKDIYARNIKLTINDAYKGTGQFVTAAEFRPYKVDGTDGLDIPPGVDIIKNLSINATNAKGLTVADQPGETINQAIDNNINTIWHSMWLTDVGLPVEVVVDMKKIYNMSKLEYVPRQSGLGGAILELDVLYSIDGKSWNEAATDVVWDKDNNTKTFVMPNNIYARYIKLVVTKSTDGKINDQSGNEGFWNETVGEWWGNFVSAAEFIPYKVAGTTGVDPEVEPELGEAIENANKILGNSNATATQIVKAISDLAESIKTFQQK